MSHHRPECWREPADRAQLLVEFSGDGMGLTLRLYPPPQAGCEQPAYCDLHLDPLGTITPAGGTVWECQVTGVADTRDLSRPVKVRPIRFVR